jgi:hypothetical protein
MTSTKKVRSGSRANAKKKSASPATPAPAAVRRGLLSRYGQVRRRMLELSGIQRRLERKGDHREAARALRERRYLELVSRLLQPAR